MSDYECQRTWLPRLSHTTNEPKSENGLVLTAHILGQFTLRHNSYGGVRITEKLKELGLQVGHRHVGRLTRQKGISVIRARKNKVTTDSNHKFNMQIDPIRSGL